MRGRKAKFAEVETIPMPFDVPSTEQRTHARQTAKSVDWDRCPCHEDAGNVGLVAQGEHLVWRVHFVTLQSGAKFQCRASGTRWCENHRGRTHRCRCVRA